MDITPLVPDNVNIIQSYSENKITINGTAYNTSIWVTPREVIPWVPSALEQLSINDFTLLNGLEVAPDVILLGTGSSHYILPPLLLKQLADLSLYPESMDNGAACRTFNVLVAEGRNVAAGLYLNT